MAPADRQPVNVRRICCRQIRPEKRILKLKFHRACRLAFQLCEKEKSRRDLCANLLGR
jgi:hypothetical protein